MAQSLSSVEAAPPPEWQPQDFQPIIQPVTYGFRPRSSTPVIEQHECCLTGEKFDLISGGLVYELRVSNSDCPVGYLAPTTVTSGKAYVTERFKEKLEKQRADALQKFHQAERMLAGASLPVRYEMPNC